MEKYDKKFEEVLEELSEIRRTKTADYGETWAETGLKGIFIKVYIKIRRLKQLVWDNQEPENESLRDTFIDIAAYAIYGVICCDEGNLDGVLENENYVEQLVEKIENR